MKGLVGALFPIGRAVMDAAQIACILAVVWAIWRGLLVPDWTWSDPIDAIGAGAGCIAIALLTAIAALGAFGAIKGSGEQWNVKTM